MESELLKSKERRQKRLKRVRQRLTGSADKPRISIYKSNRHIEVQVIDDESGKTLLGLSTRSKTIKDKSLQKKSKNSAKELGVLVAENMLSKNIKKAVLDRGPFKYHGILAAFADAAREKGLEF